MASGSMSRRQGSLLVLLAVGSGTAALVYEIVWFQLLELFLGSSAVSLGVVLAAFMGGICLGSLAFPRLVSTRPNPLRVYAAIELGIAVAGPLVLFLIPRIGGAYTGWTGYGTGGFLLRGVLAGVCLVLPTALMGATLPALARAVRNRAGRVAWIGLLYGANTAGAVLGCLVSGFYLLRVHDVLTATLAAAAVNASVGLMAWMAASWIDRRDVADLSSVERRETLHRAASWRLGEASVYCVVAISGFSALAAEAVWTRTLGLLFGASVYTLSIILAVFLAGLAVGSGIGSILARVIARPRRALGACQLLLAGAIAWTAYTTAASLPFWPIDPSVSSNIWFNFQLDLLRALWALLPPTLLWGATFPLALAGLASRRPEAGRLVAGVYAANTVGAIAGALVASWFLIAEVGSRGTEQILIAVSGAGGLGILLSESLDSTTYRARVGATLAATASVATALLVWSVPPVAGLLIAHGRYAATWVGASEILYAEEGLNASVAVSRFPGGALTLHVAGKIQASSVPRDMRLQRMLGHLTSLTAADPGSVLVIGYGAGVTAGALALDPRVKEVTVVEIEPLVPAVADAYFGEQNLNLGANPKLRVRIDDGRHYLLTSPDRFDAITADPLDPWVKGAASLYTREFLEVVKQRLTPGGVATFYVQLFETNLPAVRSTLATFFEVFPSGTIWGNTHDGQGYDLVMLGQSGPLRIDLDEIDARLQRPDHAAVASSLREIGMSSAVDLYATYAGRGEDLVPWLRDAAINRDWNLRMQYLAGTALNADDSAAIYRAILRYRRLPVDLFAGAPGRIDTLRAGIRRGVD